MTDFSDQGWLNISDETPGVAYTATAGQTAFTVPFEFFADADLTVTVDDVTKTLTTDYTVTGELEEGGGTITFGTAMTGGESVVILLDLEYELTTHIPPSGQLDIAAVNLQFSKFTAMLKQLDRLQSRSIRQPDSDATDLSELGTASARASKYLFFSATGQPTLVSAVETSVAATAFILTLLDDTTAAQARTTLGITDQSSYTGLSNWNFC